jgi:hypothetical protein
LARQLEQGRPKFSLQSLVLRREHELAADQISARITDPATAARALIATAVKGSYLDDGFWPDLVKRCKTEPEPPSNVFVSLTDKLHEQMSCETVLPLLTENWGKHDPTDSHPSLAQRVAALQPNRDWSNLNQVAQEFSQESRVSVSAAQSLLADETARLSSRLGKKWHDTLLPKWKLEYVKAWPLFTRARLFIRCLPKTRMWTSSSLSTTTCIRIDNWSD